jgi:uncharacterized membrane protein
MNMAYYIKLYLLTVPIFFAIDMIWLGFVARGFYQNQLGSFLSDTVNWTAALAFYFLYMLSWGPSSGSSPTPPTT